ncbi:NAD(P)H-dependent oxidoreductase [Streptomyces olivaceus]|uniref:NAD(P)H-dependent oxidoreductase n=1 Tax=Streptomyces olivaceus TaxID=47716 RepID=UPI003801A380
MPPAPSVLVQVAHPDLGRSRVNAALADAVRGLRHVTVRDLYGTYPDHRIDASRERELLHTHSTLVLQFPFYWYSTPPLLKQWLDQVLPYGPALTGKTLRLAVSTGSAAHAYTCGGRTGFTMAELLRPLEATAHLTGMKLAEPLLVHGARDITDEELERTAEQYQELLSTPRRTLTQSCRPADVRRP